MGAARAALLLALACGALAGGGAAESPAAGGGNLSSPPVQGQTDEQIQEQIQAHVDFAVGCVLLGAVTFVMTLFYFLNSKDPDRANYSWAIVSSAIVTFSGVLVTSAWNGVLMYLYKAHTGAPPSQRAQTNLYLCAYLGWYVALQVVLAFLSGAIGKLPASIDDMVSSCKCWATLMSMITGNSCMSFWGLVQREFCTAYPGSGLAMFLVIPICVICQLLLFELSGLVRRWVALADDGSMDQYEELWDKFVSDLEGSVVNMASAHLTIQFIRTVISGEMPLFNGTNPPTFHAQSKDGVELFLVALVFACAMVFVNLSHPKFRGKELKVTKSRLKGTLGNCIAFCLLWSINWSQGKIFGVHGVVGGMLLALVVTMLGMFLITGLDLLADLECTSEKFDEELYAFCPCISILIGFSWKQAFTTSVQTLTKQTQVFDPAIETLILTACLVTVVIPAWNMYILPVILEPELKAIKKAMGGDTPPPKHEGHFKEEGSMSTAIAGNAKHDMEAMQEADAEEQTDPSRTEGLRAPLLQKRDLPHGAAASAADMGADMGDVCFNRAAGVGALAAGDALIRRRNEELEMAIAHIRGLCAAAGSALPPK